ncbi:MULTISPECIES: aldehyde dehydrogenase family protein [Sphingomonas]|uniref:Aldehyde dehydrogenase n=1 Tax=Sphingomonas trueperi TaxID=53317 RepID=A0A7X5XY08_9SPHN|nr:aldehyde dehydrogenase family protein [Sphingomonas trueperi]NJB97167.1 aldehyde dehydrogenase (NAD+) [Sphingomonas trueperi]
MNVQAFPRASSDPGLDANQIQALFACQREAVERDRARFGLRDRLDSLTRLKITIKRREGDIISALASDFRKPEPEVRLTELFPVYQEISHAKLHLRSWTKPHRVPGSLGMFGTSAQVRYQPRGVCLIIAPWNYPVNLSLGPLASALAAGNTAIIKPSELTPATSAIIRQIVEETFPPEQVAVCEGDASVSQALLDLPFDHIFFTGSPQVGKIVMAAAAKHLTSVTLELGGKSPTIVDSTADIDDAARKIVWGKFSNNGQTCIAPDHIYVARDQARNLVDALRREIRRVYGKAETDQKGSPDYGRIVNSRHFDRLSALLDDATSHGALVLEGGTRDPAQKYIAPTLIGGTTHQMAISREEIFGPVLPLIEFDDIDSVIEAINAGPKPLALYIFSKDAAAWEAIIARTSSGGVCINQNVVQFLHPNLPFGGVNNSGIGSAHGFHGFKAFSHERAVLRDRFSVLRLLFPPYTPAVKRLIDITVRILG